MDWIINWWPATVLGPIVLIILIAYALVTRRRLTPREKQERHEGIKEVYRHNPDA